MRFLLHTIFRKNTIKIKYVKANNKTTRTANKNNSEFCSLKYGESKKESNVFAIITISKEINNIVFL